jgi:hypothetical protein
LFSQKPETTCILAESAGTVITRLWMAPNGRPNTVSCLDDGTRVRRSLSIIFPTTLAPPEFRSLQGLDFSFVPSLQKRRPLRICHRRWRLRILSRGEKRKQPSKLPRAHALIHRQLVLPCSCVSRSEFSPMPCRRFITACEPKTRGTPCRDRPLTLRANDKARHHT